MNTTAMAELAKVVGAAAREELGSPSFPNPEEWRFVEEKPYFREGRPVAELHFARVDRTLAFIVAPIDLAARVFARTSHLDVIYYSEDLPIARHNELFPRDKVMIERFVKWLKSWDHPGRELPASAR